MTEIMLESKFYSKQLQIELDYVKTHKTRDTWKTEKTQLLLKELIHSYLPYSNQSGKC